MFPSPYLVQVEVSQPSASSARSLLQGFPFRGTMFQVCASDVVLQALGFHPFRKGTLMITLGGLYGPTPLSGIIG